ncbi:unnamed protein product [Meloidogyne enterolobii]|uniref:Uncharacterized protein n=1 Tax=Meloidogyne enterolobii TaxID=390850 RepID=A0ACB0XPS8_MELEN
MFSIMVKGTGSDPGWINKFFSLFLSFENLSSLFSKFFCFFFITTNQALFSHTNTNPFICRFLSILSLGVSFNFFYFFKVGIFVYKIKGNQ